MREGYEVPFGYEEAIGFMFGPDLRDKDGVAASVVFAEFVASLQRQGKTASSRLKELCARGLAERVVDPGPPTSVTYRLTDAGRDVAPILDALRVFHRAHPEVVATPSPGIPGSDEPAPTRHGTVPR